MPTNVKWTFSIEKNLYIPTEEYKQEEAKLKQQEDVSLLIEKLNYISQKENQSGNEKANIFYMYVLGITILGAAVSQLVAVHFQIKINQSSFSVSSPALDLVASALLIAAFILTRICFSAYIQAVKSQIKWVNERNKIKKDEQEHSGNNQYDKEIPYYVRSIMIWAGSLCLGGGVAILVITGGFLINVCRLQPILSWYQLIIASLAFLIGFACSLLLPQWSFWTPVSSLIGNIWKSRPQSKQTTTILDQQVPHSPNNDHGHPLIKDRLKSLKKIVSLIMVIGFACLIFFFFPHLQSSQSSVLNCKTSDPILASQVFIITGFCFFLIFVGCFVHFKRHIDMSIRASEINNNKTQK